MQETLFRFPHSIGGLPVFGAGWVLLALAIGLVLRLIFVSRKPRTQFAGDAEGRSKFEGNPDTAIGSSEQNGGSIFSELFAWAIAAFVVWKIIPTIELSNVDGDPVGLAIRGYGIFLLAGVASAIGLAGYRARQRGIDPDIIFRMAPWAFFGGIIGARLFYVVQYRERFMDETFIKTVGNMLKFTEGGLVVYGAFIGGGLAVLYFLIRHRLPILRFGDVIVPCLFIGIFFGRMGCLMHGCCWGGRCDPAPYALEFPPGSPVYDNQLGTGTLFGLSVDPVNGQIISVEEGSEADRLNLQPGELVNSIRVDRSTFESADRDLPVEEIEVGAVLEVEGRGFRFSPSQLPERALPVFPAQIVSSIGGLLLCLALSWIRPGRVRDGTVMWLGFMGYAILRFIMEIIRVDEGGQFGTTLSISQWVSIVVLVGSLLGLALQRRWTSPSAGSVGATTH